MAVQPRKASTQRRVVFGKGGTTRMAKPQAAGTDRPGNTGKDQTAAPGTKRATGGPPVRDIGGVSRSAKPGRTGT